MRYMPWILDFKRIFGIASRTHFCPANVSASHLLCMSEILIYCMYYRHPCTDKPAVISDTSIRFTEDSNDLKIDRQPDSMREAISKRSPGLYELPQAVEDVCVVGGHSGRTVDRRQKAARTGIRPLGQATPHCLTRAQGLSAPSTSHRSHLPRNRRPLWSQPHMCFQFPPRPGAHSFASGVQNGAAGASTPASLRHCHKLLYLSLRIRWR